jgi:predicted nucleic acid-binding protein
LTKILLDLNVLLDVFQRREPHFQHSVQVLNRVATGELVGCIPGHGVTTIHYVVERMQGSQKADEAVDWLLAKLEVVPETASTFLRARGLGFEDFEDAVVASAAEQAKCDRIITRNIEDFGNSPVTAVTPVELHADPLSE